jgi:hypothetical protein
VAVVAAATADIEKPLGTARVSEEGAGIRLTFIASHPTLASPLDGAPPTNKPLATGLQRVTAQQTPKAKGNRTKNDRFKGPRPSGWQFPR